jgi:hypothetical protein
MSRVNDVQAPRTGKPSLQTSPARATPDPTKHLAGPLVGVVFPPAVGMGEARTEGRDRVRDLTRRVFEPRAGRRVIGENLAGVFAVLGGWTRADRQQPSPPPGGETSDEQPRERARSDAVLANPGGTGKPPALEAGPHDVELIKQTGATTASSPTPSSSERWP